MENHRFDVLLFHFVSSYHLLNRDASKSLKVKKKKKKKSMGSRKWVQNKLGGKRNWKRERIWSDEEKEGKNIKSFQGKKKIESKIDGD